MSRWESVCKCKCGRSVPSSWFLHMVLAEDDTCSGCGEAMRANYDTVVRRWVSAANLLKPWTWFQGHYETKGKP